MKLVEELFVNSFHSLKNQYSAFAQKSTEVDLVFNSIHVKTELTIILKLFLPKRFVKFCL